jgi:hypothetical protein
MAHSAVGGVGFGAGECFYLDNVHDLINGEP